MSACADIVADYAFYRDEYGGDLSVDAFTSALPAALRHVRWLCGAKDIADCDLLAYRRAICAADEAFSEYGEGEVGGFSIGDYSVTNYQNKGTTGSEMATSAAMKELCGTAAVFAGVGR